MTHPGLGTINNAMDLQTALNWGFVDPGDTIYLRAGTYAGNFTCALVGTAENPITIRPYQSEHVIIDGSLTDNGEYTVWQDIEFTYSGWTKRHTLIEGSFPEDMPWENSVNFNAPGCIVQRCVFHDLCGSVGFWSGAAGGIFRYNVIYHNGWSAPDRGHGHGLYSQNLAASAAKGIYGNIWWAGFCLGLKAYSTEEGYVDHYNIYDNISFYAAALYGDPNEVDAWNFYAGSWYETCDDIIFQNNYSYMPAGQPAGAINRVGYITHEEETNTGIQLIDNYWPEGRLLTNCTPDPDTGFYGPRPESGTVTAVIPTETGKGLIAVYNWDEANSVSVDVTSVLSASDDYRLINAEDYYNDITTGTVALDGTITIDMRASEHTVATPVLWDAPATCLPIFGAFMIEAV